MSSPPSEKKTSMSSFYAKSKIQDAFFDPKDYLQRNYVLFDDEIDPWHTFTLSTLNDYVAYIRKHQGGNLSFLDIGTGPCIHDAISLSQICSKIIFSDHMPQSREEITRWIKRDPTAFDWTPYMKLVAQLENTDDWTAIEQRLRGTKLEVRSCDVFADEIISGNEKFDIISTGDYLECVCASEEQIISVLAKIRKMLQFNGVLIISGLLDCTHYEVNDQRFDVLSISDRSLNRMLEVAGFRVAVAQFRYLSPDELEENEDSDESGYFMIMAQKDKPHL